MFGDRYVVTRGDSLWRIAARHLGGGAQWPRIWKYNNRPEVVRFTGRRIPNPDLIYVGQVLYVPHLPGMSRMRSGDNSGNHLPTAREAHSSPPPTSKTSSGAQPVVSASRRSRSAAPSSLSEQARKLQSPVAFKHSLDLRWPPTDVGTAIIEMKMTGDAVLMSKRSYPVTFITGRGQVEAMNATEANHAFGRLVSDNRFIFDPATKRVTMRSMLIGQSTTPGLAATAIGVEMASDSPMPKLRADIRLPKLFEGSIGPFSYIAFDVKVVLEITPKPPRAPPPGRQPKHQRSPVTASPRGESSIAWDRVIGTGLVVTAGAVVVATIVEDFFTAGAGVADDLASFAAAGLAFAHGLAMLRGTAQALPQAAARTSVTVGASVVLAH